MSLSRWRLGTQRLAFLPAQNVQHGLRVLDGEKRSDNGESPAVTNESFHKRPTWAA